jgi:hypothetical protein
MAKDTLAALLAYSHKMNVYKLLQKPDSMLIVCEDVSKLFHEAGYMSWSAGVLSIPVTHLCNQPVG